MISQFFHVHRILNLFRVQKCLPKTSCLTCAVLLVVCSLVSTVGGFTTRAADGSVAS